MQTSFSPLTSAVLRFPSVFSSSFFSLSSFTSLQRPLRRRVFSYGARGRPLPTRMSMCRTSTLGNTRTQTPTYTENRFQFFKGQQCYSWMQTDFVPVLNAFKVEVKKKLLNLFGSHLWSYCAQLKNKMPERLKNMLCAYVGLLNLQTQS